MEQMSPLSRRRLLRALARDRRGRDVPAAARVFSTSCGPHQADSLER
jgi:hypothetical protein